MRQPKIVIVGAGLVGGSAALFAAVAIPSAQIVIIDLERVRAEGQALDLAHATAFWGHDRVRAGDDADARDADIVVVTAGAGVKPGQTRLDLVQTNARILGEILDRIAPLAPEAIWVIATNPCDPLAHVAQARLRGPRGQVISTGTSLDTARLRALLSAAPGRGRAGHPRLRAGRAWRVGADPLVRRLGGGHAAGELPRPHRHASSARRAATSCCARCTSRPS